MNPSLIILGLLSMLCIAAAVPPSINALSQTTRNDNPLCLETNLADLAACGCYVQASYESSPAAEIEVCRKLFGEDLLSLKPYCKDYIKNGDVDVEAVSRAIEKVKEVCFSVAGDPSVRQIGHSDSLQHSERILPALVFVAILLYSTPAY